MVQRMASKRQKTTVYLDIESLETIERAAKERGRSSASMVREALALYAGQLDRPLPRSTGVVHSGRSDLSQRVESILAQGLGRKRSEP